MPEKLSRSEDVRNYLESYFLLANRFVTPPQVKLELITRTPPDSTDISVRDIVVTTAMQCYSPGITRMQKRTDAKSTTIADNTLAAGHHTTRQHVSYTWKLEGVSRSLVHDVLHANPYYNSEQQSQRYVEAKHGSYLIPTGLSEKQKDIYLSSADYANQAYFKFLDILEPEVDNRIRQMYPESGFKVKKTQERLTSKTKKITQEIARYVLPIAQKTNLDHSLNELQLLRLFRASQMSHYTDEARYVIGQMIREVALHDSSILTELDTPLPAPDKNPLSERYITDQKAEFDQILQSNQSILLSIPENSRAILSMATRNILGLSNSQISETDALSLLLDPSLNHHHSDVYETGIMDPLTASLREISVTYATKLSHTADSQRQRHRKTPGATPPIEAIYDNTPDYTIPLVIRENPKLTTVYIEIMNNMYTNVNKALDAGIPKESALLLLPNAQNIRVIESGDLFDWIHRWKQRLCYLAQEEIFFISVDQIEQLSQTLPEAEKLFLAPCGIRQATSTRPRCPEGDRWCGKPVFSWDIDKYTQNRLI